MSKMISKVSAFILAAAVFACGNEPEVTVDAPPLPLAVEYIYPVNGQQNIPLNPVIYIVFNQEMDSASLSHSIYLIDHSEDDRRVIVERDYSPQNFEATLIPQDDLKPASSYSVVISKGLTAKSGATLGADIISTFETTSVLGGAPLSILRISPPHGATDINVSVMIDALFNQPLSMDTSYGDFFKIRPATGSPISASVVVGDLSDSESKTLKEENGLNITETSAVKLIAKPDKPLAYETDYIIWVSGELTAASGAKLSKDVESYFKTRAEKRTNGDDDSDVGVEEDVVGGDAGEEDVGEEELIEEDSGENSDEDAGGGDGEDAGESEDASE
ncbi:MAG: hypothetical protein Kow0090_00890 [Myxococcota bacterium]